MHRKEKIRIIEVSVFLFMAILLLFVGFLYKKINPQSAIGSLVINGHPVLAVTLPHGSGALLPADTYALMTCPTDAPPAGYQWATPNDLVLAGANDPLVYEYTNGFVTEKQMQLPLLSRWSGEAFSTRGLGTLTQFSAGRTYFITAANPITIFCSVPQGSSSSSSSGMTGDHEYWIETGGTRRRYLLHVPPTYQAGIPMPLVIAMHGGGGNAENTVSTFQLNPVADQHGFLVAYPEGSGSVMVFGKVSGSWNAGGCCGEAALRQTDDVGFISTMLDAIESSYGIDPKRVFATGFSNGSMMSYKLAVDMSDRIAAIAPIAGQAMILSWSHLTRSVPTLHIHGTADPCALYNGSEPEGICGSCLNRYYEQIGIPTVGTGGTQCNAVPVSMRSWAGINRFINFTRTVLDTPTVQCIVYDQRAIIPGWNFGNAEIELCSIEGLGHNFPKANPTYDIAACNPDCSVTSCNTTQQYIYNNYCVPWKNIVGPLSSAVDAPNVLWDFFSRHPMP